MATALQQAFSACEQDLEAEVLFDEPLKPYCSFKIGGPAEILCTPKNEKALIRILLFAKEQGARLTVLGNGSNVLVPDEGIPGITVRLAEGLTDLIYLGDDTIAAGAGLPLSRLCLFALEKKLTGLEFAYGIPGSVGGAVYMNAGAYGGEIKNVLLAVRAVSLNDGSVREIPARELPMAHRSTPFMKEKTEIITAAYFKLAPGDETAIGEKMSELMGRRRASQPLEYPSAGSTFKRPPNGYASAMIDQCGLKGLAVGGACVSPKHAGFVINTDGATAADVTALMREIQKRVYDQTGTMLEPEVEIL